MKPKATKLTDTQLDAIASRVLSEAFQPSFIVSDNIQMSLSQLAKRIVEAPEIINIRAAAAKAVVDYENIMSLPKLDSFLKSLEPFTTIAGKFLEGLEEFDEKLKQVHEKDMTFLSPYFEGFTTWEINDMFLQPKQSAIVGYDSYLSNQENIESIFSEWCSDPDFFERKVILKDALDAHVLKKYTLSIPVLTAQLEGLIYKKLTSNYKNVINIFNSKAGVQKELPLYHSTSGAKLFGAVMAEQFFKSQLEHEHKPENHYPNRHIIQHGLSVNYYKQPHASTRLIMLLDFLRSTHLQVYLDEYSKGKKKKNNKKV